MTPRAFFVLLAIGVTWGASFLFIKVLVEDTSPLEVAAGRLTLGAVAVLLFLRWRGSALPRGLKRWSQIACLALVSNVAPFILIGWAEEHIESGTASVLNSTMPLFTALFASAVLVEERMTAGRAFGLASGFLGVAVLMGGDAGDIASSSVAGQLAVVLAAACYSVGTVISRNLLRTEDPLGLSAGQLAVASLLMVPITLGGRGAPDFSLSVEAWLSLLGLGLLGTGAAYVAYLWLIDNIGSVRTSLVTYVIPVVGLLLGWAVLDESIGVNTLAGFVLIVAGVASVMRGQAPSSRRMAAVVVVEP